MIFINKYDHRRVLQSFSGLVNEFVDLNDIINKHWFLFALYLFCLKIV